MTYNAIKIIRKRKKNRIDFKICPETRVTYTVLNRRTERGLIEITVMFQIDLTTIKNCFRSRLRKIIMVNHQQLSSHNDCV